MKSRNRPSRDCAPLGHAATLTHPQIAALNRNIGLAATGVSAAEIARLERVYWYTLEFGLVEQAGTPKAFGAGILSSCGELEQFQHGPELCDWDLDRMAETTYDPTDMQPRLFVAPSFTHLVEDVSAWVSNGRWRERAT